MSTRQKHVCSVVPPYLLQSIAASTENSAPQREAASRAINLTEAYITKRENRFAALTAPPGVRHASQSIRPQGIVPDALLAHIAESADVEESTRDAAKRDLAHIQSVKAKFQQQQLEQQDQKTLTAETTKQKPAEKTYRAVYDAGHDFDESKLPGKLIRAEGQNAASDEAVNQAYDNAGRVLDFYKSIFKWNSIDNQNMHVISSVHFGQDYENAFWDPEHMQMCYGDGGSFIHNFTNCIDVIGHEITHAVTEHASNGLIYSGQSGALNEHVSDVFGIMIKQRYEDETAANADWLIGEGCLLPDVKGVALRSMKDPGSAYDDPRFGKDPQPDNFKDYKITTSDNGGVHLYSGIPNKAFYLASVAFGGYSWEKAGRIWWETMRSGQVPPKCTFIQFADTTVDQAEHLFGQDAAAIVRKAWKDVGVVRKT